ncbi:MAG: SUMF1/EgtB/PvdO family nonheme iron enzyme, partial [Bacteroidales bacterium]|nr:SUMF1/EgtB/PvdO family nonheme iron enzyme [Bacteroidales bacterium]
LVFIPIISRTYCDPKSFAWEHEFKAFIEQASKDQFGLKIKLSNGNVASRVLPVHIHNLDEEDNKLCESIIGAVLRGVEFIYRSPGINRPLRSTEDKPKENLNNTIYRDQINKVALTIKEIISAFKKGLEQDEKAPIYEKVESKSGRSFKLTRKLSYIITLVTIFSLIITFISLKYLYNLKEKKHIYSQVIPNISKLTDDISSEVDGMNGKKSWEAFKLLKATEKKLPGDTNLLVFQKNLTRTINILSEPAEASVYGKSYLHSDTSWYFLGQTPLLNTVLPKGSSCIKIQKEDYQVHIDAFTINWNFHLDTLFYKLVRKNEATDGMILVAEQNVRLNLNGLPGTETQHIGDFLIDQFEVTNEKYKRFIDDGGYTTPKYWKHKFIKNRKSLSWNQAMLLFKDDTDWPGPSGWITGRYPSGEEKNPVSGISWYEAAAFAEYSGKSLPTVFHWCAFIDRELVPLQIRYSNFNNRNVSPVGFYNGIGRHGIYDNLGNVREWIYNQYNDNNLSLGGSAYDPIYYSVEVYMTDPWERNKFHGFRCIKYENDENRSTLEKAFTFTTYDKSKDIPVSDETFNIIARQFGYDRKPIVIKNKIDGRFNGWKQEIITIEPAYEGPDLEIYVFMPENAAPPYQSVVLFPGRDAEDLPLFNITDYITRNNFLINSGRVVVLPRYFGTYGRGGRPKNVLEWKESTIKKVKDFQRTLDYLETRMDLDTSKFAYLGISWGGFHSPYIIATERRIKLGIVSSHGASGGNDMPEFYHLNYLSRITIPMLMLSGIYDDAFPYETSQQLYYNWLATSKKDKKWVVYEASHNVPQVERVKETINWLDRYFGTVVNK